MLPDAEIDAVRAKMAALFEAGELTASCPFEGMNEPWTEGEKACLKSALADMFGWKHPTVD